jgi:hypothetical protein
MMRIMPVRATAAVYYENVDRDILKFAANLRIWISRNSVSRRHVSAKAKSSATKTSGILERPCSNVAEANSHVPGNIGKKIIR